MNQEAQELMRSPFAMRIAAMRGKQLIALILVVLLTIVHVLVIKRAMQDPMTQREAIIPAIFVVWGVVVIFFLFSTYRKHAIKIYSLAVILVAILSGTFQVSGNPKFIVNLVYCLAAIWLYGWSSRDDSGG